MKIFRKLLNKQFRIYTSSFIGMVCNFPCVPLARWTTSPRRWTRIEAWACSQLPKLLLASNVFLWQAQSIEKKLYRLVSPVQIRNNRVARLMFIETLLKGSTYQWEQKCNEEIACNETVAFPILRLIIKYSPEKNIFMDIDSLFILQNIPDCSTVSNEQMQSHGWRKSWTKDTWLSKIRCEIKNWDGN